MTDIDKAFYSISEQLPNDDGTLRRIERAYRIVKGIDPYEFVQLAEPYEHIWEVSRVSTRAIGLDEQIEPYEVDTVRHTCTCPDFVEEKCRAGLCKHRIAVMVVIKSKEE
jgi:hypothetical protein